MCLTKSYLWRVIPMTKSTTIADQLIYRSDVFGRAFWVNEYNDLQSAPLFVDNKIDFDNADYVSDWDDYSEVDVRELLNIYALVVNHRKFSELDKDHVIVEVI